MSLKRNPNHLSFNRGKRLLVKMESGQLFVDKFLEKRSRHLLFEKKGKVPISKMVMVSLFKAQTLDRVGNNAADYRGESDEN